jgi:lipoic acid synthetase
MIKSGLMAGMGETDEEIVKTIFDLKKAGVEIITIGQYLPPGEKNWELKRYVPPEKFEEWSAVARQAGFTMAFCGPMVRSSYHAGEIALSAAAVASEAGKHTEDSRL